MEKENKLSERKPTRIKNFDYNSKGAYFITICTENRRRLLSRVVIGDARRGDATRQSYDSQSGEAQTNVGDDVLGVPKTIKLTPYGKTAENHLKKLNDFYDNVCVDRYVIMPNHIHIMLIVTKDGTPRTSSPTRQCSTVPQFVSTFKRYCNKEYGENIWQRSFNDHIIRNHEDYEEHIRYITDNPTLWYYDELYTER